MDNQTNQLLFNADVERRVESLESDMKRIKPIVYSVKQIEKSVERMEVNSEKIKGYFLSAVITGIVGIVYVALQNSF